MAETALATLQNDFEGQNVLANLLSLSVAFATVNHGILLKRLSGLGIDGLAWVWLWLFLEDCPQRAWGNYVRPLDSQLWSPTGVDHLPSGV